MCFFLSSAFFAGVSWLKKAFALAAAARICSSVALCRINWVCVSIVRIKVCSPHAKAMELPRARQEEIAATLIIPLFIQLKLASDLVHLHVFTRLFRRKKQILALLAQRQSFCHVHSWRITPINRRCMTGKQSQSRPVFMLTARALRKPTVLGAFFLLLNSALPAANYTRPLDIRVQASAFGTASSADLTALLQSVAFEIWRYCPRTQLSGIDVYHRPDHPQTDFQRTASGRIAIGLAARDTHWAQYSFQFAHEFCHTLANFSNRPQRLVRYPPHDNFWLEESLCETASLFTLRAMSRTWRTGPPYPAWRDYAPWLNAYTQQRLTLPEHQLPAGKPFLDWFREHQSALRRNSTIRDWNTIIAIRLLPIFEADPRGWEAVTFLNVDSSATNASLAQHLAAWRSHCPEGMRPFIRKLATVFAITL